MLNSTGLEGVMALKRADVVWKFRTVYSAHLLENEEYLTMERF